MSIASIYPPIVAVSGDSGVKFEDYLNIVCPGVGVGTVASCPVFAANLLN